MTKNTSARSSNGPALVLYGTGDDERPRAAYFKAGQTALVTKAAEAMQLGVIEVTSPDLEAIATRLPKGRIHSSGKGFVPFVRPDLYAKLTAVVGLPQTNGHRGAGEQQPSHALPRDWDDIAVGHIVIAQESAKDGWWEAIVLEVDSDMLTVRWRDYPRLSKFKRHRQAVALLRPIAA